MEVEQCEKVGILERGTAGIVLDEQEKLKYDFYSCYSIIEQNWSDYQSMLRANIDNLSNWISCRVEQIFNRQLQRMTCTIKHVDKLGQEIINKQIQKESVGMCLSDIQQLFIQRSKEFDNFKAKMFTEITQRYSKEIQLESLNTQKEFSNFFQAKERRLERINNEMIGNLSLIFKFKSVEEMRQFKCYKLEPVIQVKGNQSNISEILNSIGENLLPQSLFDADISKVEQKGDYQKWADYTKEYQNCYVYESMKKKCEKILLEVMVEQDGKQYKDWTTLQKQDNTSLWQIFRLKHKQYVLKYLDGQQCPIKLFSGKERQDPVEYKDNKMQVMWGMNCIKQFMIGAGVFYNKNGAIYKDCQAVGVGLDKNIYGIDNGYRIIQQQQGCPKQYFKSTDNVQVNVYIELMNTN